MLISADEFNNASDGRFPGYVGFHATVSEIGHAAARLIIQSHHLAPNGYLHAGVVVTLADTTCGMGARGVLPEGASGFTTLELKSNHIGTAREGTIEAVATAVHAGRTSQVWDGRGHARRYGQDHWIVPLHSSCPLDERPPIVMS